MSQVYAKSEPEPILRPLNIQEDRTATNQQARPWPVFWGTHRRAGIWLDQVYRAGTRTITRRVQTGKSSSENVNIGVEYYGGIAQAVGFGPLHSLKKIMKGDAVVWDLDDPDLNYQTIVDSEGHRLVTISGESSEMVLYHGTREFTPLRNAAVFRDENLPDGHPSYRGLIWFNFYLSEFGQSPTPPNFELIFEVLGKALVLDPTNNTGDPENDDPELHRVDGGQLIPEIIYDALTNPYFGEAMTPDQFDIDSWVEACKTLKIEGMGYSPMLETKTGIDSWVKGLLNVANADIVNRDGKWVFKLLRPDDAVKVIPETSFLSDPSVTPGSYYDKSIVNEVRVPFSILDDNLEDRTIPGFDDTSRQIAGVRSKAFAYDGFRSEEAAANLANLLAKRLGSPEVTIKASLDRRMIGIEKGDLIQPFYPETGLLGDQLVRVRSVTESGSGGGGIEVTGVFDKGALDNILAGALDDLGSTVDDITPGTFSFRGLPIPDSQSQGYLDGVILPMSREKQTDDRARVWLGWDDVSYEVVSGTRVFPLEVVIHGWRDFGNGQVVVELEFSRDHEKDSFVESITDRLPEWHLLTQCSSAPLDACWAAVLGGSDLQVVGDRFFVTLQSGQFDTTVWSKDTSGPRLVGYLGPYEAFLHYRTNSWNIFRSGENGIGDTAEIRRFKVQSSARSKTQDFGDSADWTYTRPTGTLNSDWGIASPHAFDYGIATFSTTGPAPLTSQIDITGTENANIRILWGDGSPLQTFNDTAVPVSYQHTYNAVGNYTAEIEVTPTAGGAKQTFDVAITVS